MNSPQKPTPKEKEEQKTDTRPKMPPKTITTQDLPTRPGNYKDRSIGSDSIEKH